ncbi:hypothetical protein PH235_07625 [Trichococcus sp. K1Tr]|uniref:SIR2 family NAD-dependent protein deacylase n=1 Tax=Trichococcus sp. K1Tr TaxID=3020847 RepID=UPI00232DBCA7|nr:Sir2 family NAD-dependent protein deacetylase [Trichococcus sp. K1Tr]MDB6353429.1 hypothetical protein [Trichococcus sp. K1Tr]
MRSISIFRRRFRTPRTASERRAPLPNAAHRFFAALEDTGKEVTIVTQNIDNLHQSAGSSAIIELHGNGARWRTFDTGEPADASAISMDAEGIQRNPQGKMVRPDIVLYGEMLDEEAMERAAVAIGAADMLVVIGTSLAVYPAASFVRYFKGPYAVLLNRTPVPQSLTFQLAVQTDAGAFLADVWGKYFAE